jgi:ligand-binding SRPBCC domain-containing protein
VATLHRLERRQLLQRPVDDVFAFYADAANLEALTPPFLRFRILSPMPIAMRAGTRIEYSLSLYGVPIRWRTLITRWDPGVAFVDEQEAGPYAYWRHEHAFEAHGGATLMRDTVDYREPLGALGQIAHAIFVRRSLQRIFDFRRDAVHRLLGGAGPNAAEAAGPTSATPAASRQAA